MPDTGPTSPDVEAQPKLVVPRLQLTQALNKLVAAGEKYGSRKIAGASAIGQLADEIQTWHEYNVHLLRRSFSTSELADEYSGFSLSLDEQERGNPAGAYLEVNRFLKDRLRRLGSYQQ